MNDFTLVCKNLFRRKLRAILMIVSILIAFLIFGVLAGVYASFTAGEDRAAADRLVVVNKVNFTQPLPIAYYNRVRSVAGIRQVTHANWFGGYYQDPKNFLVVMAVEPETYTDIFSRDFDFAPEARQAFIRTRTGAMVGEAMVRKWGWKVGDRVPIASNIFSQRNGSHTWDLDIVGIFTGKTRRTTPILCSFSTTISMRHAPSARTRSAGLCCRPRTRPTTTPSPRQSMQCS